MSLGRSLAVLTWAAAPRSGGDALVLARRQRQAACGGMLFIVAQVPVQPRASHAAVVLA